MKPNLTFEAVLAALGGIFVIVLLVERVTEIVITLSRQSKADEIKAEIDALRDQATNAVSLQQKLAIYQAQTKSIALLVGFSVSIVVCAAGVGLLGAVIDTSKASPKFLRGVDIVLTAALIAGGSDGFHKFVSALESFFTESKKRIEKKT